jgi:hypothetical protein
VKQSDITRITHAFLSVILSDFSIFSWSFTAIPSEFELPVKNSSPSHDANAIEL